MGEFPSYMHYNSAFHKNLNTSIDEFNIHLFLVLL
jgi:hypothetical protein